MRSRIVLLLAVGLIGIQCGDSSVSRSRLDFSQMEIHHVKSFARRHTIGVAVYSDGSAHAFVFSGVSLGDTLSHSSRVLDLNERESLSELFGAFSSFEPEYTNTTISDGNYWVTRLIYDGSVRSVMVLDKAKGVPDELWEAIRGMDALWESTIGDEGRALISTNEMSGAGR